MEKFFTKTNVIIFLALLGVVLFWSTENEPVVPHEQVATCKFVATAASVLMMKESLNAGEGFLAYAKMLDLYQEELKNKGEYVEVELDTDKLLMNLADSFEDNQCVKLAEMPEINKFITKAKQITSKKYLSV
jgi:hypothetical protein